LDLGMKGLGDRKNEEEGELILLSAEPYMMATQ
jgi:hypothetical protein